MTRSWWRAASGVIALTQVAALAAQQAPGGKAVYDKWCAECHGNTGAGDGSAAAYMLPRPRDFTKGVYQIRTTASGEIPTDADILRIVDEGMPGTAMPEWKSRLTDSERADVVAYIKSFSRFFTNTTAKTVEVGKAPSTSDESIAEGRTTYDKLECFKCHGQNGLGDGPSAPTLTDDWDFPVRAADLSASWNFTGGNSVEEIYTRLRTGLDGTPMPSFSDAIDAKLITDEQLWRTAQYVRSLSPEKAPPVREVIRAALVEGEAALPSSPADSAWNRAERHFIPLVGQIVIKPRWFAPMVSEVWVQAMHDGKRLAVKLTWHDPSKSPDAAWDEWLGRVSKTMTDTDGPLATQQGPDRFSVQFPMQLHADAEPPFFLGGSTRRPAYMWRWTGGGEAPDAVEEGRSTGLGQFTSNPGARGISHAARYSNGEWQLQITRALMPADTAAAPAFASGQAIPVAFFASDGSNGESEVRGSASAWYSIYLDVPTPSTVYIIPVVAVLLTAGVGLMLVMQAQRREGAD
ncbi:MAG: c-type cytochrome [Gemmatimonadaceae bacterium]